MKDKHAQQVGRVGELLSVSRSRALEPMDREAQGWEA